MTAGKTIVINSVLLKKEEAVLTNTTSDRRYGRNLMLVLTIRRN